MELRIDGVRLHPHAFVDETLKGRIVGNQRELTTIHWMKLLTPRESFRDMRIGS